jgi:hypothetical protein
MRELEKKATLKRLRYAIMPGETRKSWVIVRGGDRLPPHVSTAWLPDSITRREAHAHGTALEKQRHPKKKQTGREDAKTSPTG